MRASFMNIPTNSGSTSCEWMRLTTITRSEAEACPALRSASVGAPTAAKMSAMPPVAMWSTSV